MMASPNPPLDLEITLISAKHLKNVNWRNGQLNPYAVLYLDSEYRLATHADDSGSTRPVWNERFTLPLTRPIRESVLTIEIFHSRVSEIAKPLVGSLKFPLARVDDDGGDGFEKASQFVVRSLELLRPSGRPQGKIRVKLAIKERPLPPPPPPPPTVVQDYHNAPDYSHYYYSPPPPFPAPPREYSYYSSYYSPHPPPPPPSQPQPMPPRTAYNRTYSIPTGSVPSAPVDFSPSNDYKPPPLQLPRASNYTVPGGSGPSAPVDYTPYDQKLQKQFGGMSLEEEVTSNPREKNPENEFAKGEGYSYNDYRNTHDY